MGGEVLELLDDRAKRMHQEGIEQGIKQGREEGHEEDRQEMVAAMAELGYSQEAIDELIFELAQDELPSKVAKALQNFVPRDIDASDILQAVGNGEFR